MAETTLTFLTRFIKTDCDLSNCEICKEIIYSENNSIVFEVAESGKIIKTDLNLCNSCFDCANIKK